MGAMDHRGTWRIPTELWTTGTQTQRAASEPGGTQRNTNRKALRPQIYLFSRFSHFGPPRFPFSSPNTQRFGGFETLSIGWRVEYRSEEKGQRAQWTTAEPDGAPQNDNRAVLSPEIHLFVGVFALCALSFDPCLIPSPSSQSFGGSETPFFGGRAEYRREEKCHRAQ